MLKIVFTVLLLNLSFCLSQETNKNSKPAELLKNIQSAYDNGDYKLHKTYSDSLYHWGKANKAANFQILGMVNQAVFHNNIGEQDKSIELYRDALSIADSIPNDYRTKIIILVNLGNVYTRINSHQKAIGTMENVLSLLDEFEDNPKIRASAYNGLANNYEKLKNYEKSLEFHFKTKELGEQINNEKIIATALNNISDTYQIQGKYELAVEVCERALNLEYTKQPTKEKVWLLSGLAMAQWKQNDLENAIKNLNMAKKIAIEKGLTEAQMEIYDDLSKVYLSINDSTNASSAKENYLSLKNDFLERKQNATRIDLEKDISAKNAMLQKKESDIADLANNRKILKFWSLALGGILFILLLLFYFYSKRLKTQQKLLQEQFENLKKGKNVNKEVFIKSVQNTPKEKNNTYKNSSLKEEDLNKHKKSLSVFMKKMKPYLDPDLSQKDLAKKIGISSHHLSEVLNVGYNQNFYNFVNSYRILEAQKLIQEENYKDAKLVAIAFDSGFKSKTSFNRAFKSHTGKTPSEYKNSITKN
ncbi:AraC family transcriptional regulator [Croceivirga thetidis]|uniref:AraC family transcriptional regulator n=1 Tax=Croceivirga thetidis TaxID=2721623 RepID=A0ABX1GRE3_9FLAO|nr:AraC family transcriptional regulator [Croceivirga thetidis]NKI31646.1 AraC family transcriptional regulator [Croceivirga thetidis]